jgi:hypothetical protein
MELAVYLSQLRHLEDLDDIMRPLDTREIPGSIAAALSRSANGCREGVANGLATTFLAGTEVPLDLRRLYFGQEFCESLIPAPKDLRQAYFTACQMGWEFTYVTGYVTGAGLDRTMANLAALAQECDWGVLRALRRDFPSFVPVLGRLLTKQPRLPRHAGQLPPLYGHGIQTPGEEIRPRQLQALRETNLGIPAYARLLGQNGIGRIDLDPVPQGLAPEAIPGGCTLSVYAPWTCAATSRTCQTAAVADARRQSAVPDTPCSRPCRHLNRDLEMGTFDETIVLRGNSAFSYNMTYLARYLSGTLPVDRLVFQPYIPI